jgi:hypothetical protein
VYLIDRGVYYSLPFLILFQVGFAYVGLASVYEGIRGRVGRWVRVPAPAPSAE